VNSAPSHDSIWSTRRGALLRWGLVVALLALAREAYGALSLALFALSMVMLYANLLGGLAAAVRERRMTRRRLLGTTLGLCAVSLVLVGSFTKGDFHRSHSHRDENLVPDPELGWVATLPPEHAESGIRPEERVGQRLEAIDSDRQHVLLLGDSVMYGWGLDEADTISAQLREHIESDDIQVLNGAVSGYGIPQYVIQLPRELSRLDARYVVIGVYAGNDYTAAGRDNWYGHPQPLFVPDGDGIRLHREHTPPSNCFDRLASSRLFNVLWGLSSSWGHKDRVSALLDLVCNARVLSSSDRDLAIRRMFAVLERTAEAHGSTLLFFLLADKNDFRDVREDYRQLASFLEEGGHNWLDGLGVLRESGVQLSQLYLPDDAAHVTRRGGAIIAEAIAEELWRLEALRP